MALLQISEPGQSTAPHQHKLSVSIDLGTTNSLVGSIMSGENRILGDSQGERILPSVVHCGKNNEVEVGNSALKYLESDPTNTITSVKRFMGIGKNDVKNISVNFQKEASLNIIKNLVRELKFYIQLLNQAKTYLDELI